MNKRDEAVKLLQHYFAQANGGRSAADLSGDQRLEIAEIVDFIIDAAVFEMRRAKSQE